MDPQQHQILHLRHPTQGVEDGRHLHRQLNRHPGNVQASRWAIHRHVQKKSLLALVHWWGHGRDVVHWGWVQHERPRLLISAISGRHCWGGGRIRGRRKMINIYRFYQIHTTYDFIMFIEWRVAGISNAPDLTLAAKRTVIGMSNWTRVVFKVPVLLLTKLVINYSQYFYRFVGMRANRPNRIMRNLERFWNNGVSRKHANNLLIFKNDIFFT